MKRKWPVYLMSLAIVAACVWGVFESSKRIRYERTLNGMYEKSFYELIDNMENLEVKLEKLLIAQDSQSGSRLIADIWRQSYAVSGNLSELPASTGATQEAMQFVNRLGEYCMSLSYQDGITQENKKTIQALLKACKSLTGSIESLRLSAMQGSLVLGRPLTEQGDMPMDGIGASGIDYPTLIYDGPFSDVAAGRPRALGGQTYSREQARELALDFVGRERVAQIAAAGELEGEIPAWRYEATLTDENVLSLSITKQGGLTLWMLPQNVPQSPSLQLDQAQLCARDFLTSHGFAPMELVDWQVSGAVALFTYTSVQYDALIYPDMIKLQISLETGEALGFDAGNYVRSHTLRGYPDIAVNEQDALDAVDLEEKEARLCLIPMNANEIWCYQVKGRRSGDTYFVYVDVTDGEIINILKLVSTDSGSLTV